VLERAFRGELVPQDPSDEPASVLLERTRAERDADGAASPAGALERHAPSLEDDAGRRGGEYDRAAKQPTTATDDGEPMMTVHHLPPRGHYLAHEVGRLAGVSGQTIGQWARHGYIRSSQSDAPPRVYSYQDVAEAMIVHELRDRDVPYTRIQETIRNLRQSSGNAWPLTHAKIGTVGKHVVAEEEEAFFDIGEIPWHGLAIDRDDVERIASDLRRGGWAARELPDLAHIEVDPDRLSGRPVVRGTRVPAELVAELAEDPAGREELREGYGVDDAQIDDALEWWHAVAKYDKAA
jgi:uncharacterized protein (DUF433 family)